MIQCCRRVLLTLLTLLTSTAAQLPPCGIGACRGFTHGSSYKCWDYPSPEIIDPAELKAWVNCSDVLPEDWKVVIGASNAEGDGQGHITNTPLDFCGNYYYNHGMGGASYKHWLEKNPTLAANKKCHNIIKTALCTMKVAPWDIEGKTNHYAWRGHVDYGASMCRSVCHDFWDACGLYNDTVASTYTHLAGFACYTPQTNRSRTGARPYHWPSPTRGKTGCWHLNGTVALPDCAAFVGFECKNGGVWHPECTGCLCKPGFGGSDCGRCSSKREMWPHVNRSANVYGSRNVSRSGTSFAAAACAVMSGLNSNTGPIGNGAMVDLNASQCTEIEVLRPLPVKTENVTFDDWNHTNGTRLNVSSVAEQMFDCSFDPGHSALAGYKNAYSRVKYGIVASEDCFEEKETDPWNSPDCDVRGNLTIDIFKAMPPPYCIDWKESYSPHGIHCDFSGCVQGEHEECINNHVPEDYVQPCIKCKTIQCDCPSHSVQGSKKIFGSIQGCVLTFLFPDLKTGTDSPSYLGCSRSTGFCSVYNSLLPTTLVLPSCRSSTCAMTPPASSQAPRFPVFLLFYLGVAALMLLTLVLCLNATMVRATCFIALASFIAFLFFFFPLPFSSLYCVLLLLSLLLA